MAEAEEALDEALDEVEEEALVGVVEEAEVVEDLVATRDHPPKLLVRRCLFLIEFYCLAAGNVGASW